MKKLTTYLSVFAVAVSVPILTNCDSDMPDYLDPDKSDALRAESEASPIAGDVITFSPELNQLPERNNIVFDGRVTSVDEGNANISYEKSGRYSFTLSIEYNPRVSLLNALDNTIGGDLGSPLNARIRQLIDRDEPVFSTSELEEIRDILNPSGAHIVLDESGRKLYAIDRTVYHQDITSNYLSFKRGEVTGVYRVNYTGVEIGFERATASQVNRYRNIDYNDWIPFVNEIPVDEAELERGTFDMLLINRNQ